MKLVKTKYKSDISITDTFRTWIKLYKGFFGSIYFRNLLSFIAGSYLANKDTLPIRPTDIFKPFRMTDYNNLKVVIIGDYPYADTRNIGVAYGNRNTSLVGHSLATELIRRKIETSMYNGLRLDFDYTLTNWSKQGILLLNSSLTCKQGDNKIHILYWKNFIRETISLLSRAKEGIIFVFWGEDANKFSINVDTKFHTVLRSESPVKAAYEKRKWNTDDFNKINLLIAQTLGIEEQIEW